MNDLIIKISNIFWSIKNFSFTRKRKVHNLSFTPLYGFFPWGFRKDFFNIFFLKFPGNRSEIVFYLVKKNQSIFLNWEIRKNGLAVDFGSFKDSIKRRKYDITVIRTKSTTQISLNSEHYESFQSKVPLDFNFCFIFGRRELEKHFKTPVIKQSIDHEGY